VAVVLASVGIGGVAPAATAVPDACQLLKAADIARVLGGTVEPGVLDRAADGSETICDWIRTTTKRGNMRGYGVQLDVHPDRAPSDFITQRRVAHGRTATVKHLGDAAFAERAVVSGHVFDDLWVRVGRAQFRVELLADLGPKPLQRLAVVVVRNLQGPAPPSS
jgi:hypothetical protein